MAIIAKYLTRIDHNRQTNSRFEAMASDLSHDALNASLEARINRVRHVNKQARVCLRRRDIPRESDTKPGLGCAVGLPNRISILSSRWVVHLSSRRRS